MTLLKRVKIKHLSKGFTLFELIVVLMIISIMVTIAIPYASRSNDAMKIKQAGLNIADAIKYAINLAADTNRPTRIVFDPKGQSFWLEMATAAIGYQFYPIENFQGSIRYLDESIIITNMEGMDFESGTCCLIFDPAKPWPKARITISTSDIDETIIVKGLAIKIEEKAL